MELARRRGGLRILMRLCEEVVILVGWIGGFPTNACYDTTRHGFCSRWDFRFVSNLMN